MDPSTLLRAWHGGGHFVPFKRHDGRSDQSRFSGKQPKKKGKNLNMPVAYSTPHLVSFKHPTGSPALCDSGKRQRRIAMNGFLRPVEKPPIGCYMAIFVPVSLTGPDGKGSGDVFAAFYRRRKKRLDTSHEYAIDGQ